MKKILSFIFLFFVFICTFAQLDREHWFAPMVDRTTATNPYQRLYLSTNRTTPFPVSIYNNNILIGTVTISKNNPQKFDVLRNYIITTLQTDLFTPTTKGLYLKAEFPFYANLRFSVMNHAEIITSKGIPSTGKNFYVATAPISVNNQILNFMTSVLATEDNTTVTITGYKNTVQFSNGTTGATNPTLTFTLNKGQSYIIDGIGTIAGNFNGFIGAHITSTKPVNITNGNFNGQYAGSFQNNSDILMDQSVPVERLGNEFALVKGNGSIGSNMEGAIIIATEDNTQIFVNNETVALTTLNTGQYFVVPDSKYQLHGSSHYNLYIRTSKNAYVYQILAGDSNPSNEVATGGFNFIPALNCYLPKKIDELGLINENFVYSINNPSGILNIPTKLNLITERGAVVNVNGAVPPVSTGPFDMTGTNNWVTYGIPNVTGTLTITSTKAITAGITAGTDAVGYGGFFAGFPTQPVILKSGGDCAPGIVLTVDPIIYDTYQWFVNNTPIPGATSSSYTPTQSGYYTCSVTMGSCAPLITEKFKVLNCTKQSTAIYDVCTSKTITPAFSSSTQTPVPSTAAITTAPTLGTATVNPATGVITYIVNNPGTTGTDTFTYTFCGNNIDFPDCETVTVNINIQVLTVTNASLSACTVNGQGTFNLTTANVTSSSGTTVTYYPTLTDAQNENPAALITTPTAYTAANGTIIYAVVKNNLDCKSIAQITLTLFPLAVVTENYTGAFCDDNLDGTVTITLSDITAIVLNNPSYFTNVRYYANLSDATAGNNNILPNTWSYTTATTIYIRVESPNGCAPVIKPLNFTIGSKIPLQKTSLSISVCDDDLDGIKQVSLSSYISQFTTDPAVTVTYHGSLQEAQNDVNPLNNPINLTGSQTIYVRFEKTGVCPNIASINVTIKIPKKSDLLTDQVICPKAKTNLDAGPNFESYHWSTGATSQSITNVPAGNYWVDLTYQGCVYRQHVSVTESQLPVITSIEINGQVVTVGASGGNPPYEYSLDGVTWQSSNVFNNVPRGNHTLYVRDSKRCEDVTRTFVIINLINTITPNGDGTNDDIDYSALMNNKNLEFRIFDRYGAEVFRGTPSNWYTWDGNMGGRPVNTATYWYFISWTELGGTTTVKYTSWLLVKHR
ncbi:MULTISPECIES: T9SS type B sorting domain-containing protein [Chryseobacterium]|uniref:Gliding motility-associated-like protein n=1 Tax=Chryseobacterium camelliae TaxID=1265445 RepID=A0ABU0TLB3_9FLAO|nr:MULTISPECIES: T9SS type B sorting domain-containing protein [Chryseobacterium]MDT3408314.1 gliding motility-associated-like protein [Pseudacidovorax intermedius]MDQ1097829.1 gliding motility-associated-like protein [Chryseobacterium camelliae]MDQ1101762.1 gliding motility-associated-like protein [Chryseobacterium sp. SORGH_AS_1048]MDR6085202.1 gliding motility-associated-like protein [Chryseobacterium sp. SORGH_AS_0909]MDR6129560.1 gliding motility-associated-like protein [Chryseobacterium 